MKSIPLMACLLLASAALADDAPPPPQTPSQTPMAALIGPALNVTDPDRSIAFYRDGLGMNLAMTLETGSATEYMLAFGTDPRQPGIILQRENGSSAPLTQGTAFNRIVVRTTDLDAIAARLDAAGYAHTPIRDVAHGYRMMMATDPDGYRLELVQSAARP